MGPFCLGEEGRGRNSFQRKIERVWCCLSIQYFENEKKNCKRLGTFCENIILSETSFSV